jgi:hypothetical protein
MPTNTNLIRDRRAQVGQHRNRRKTEMRSGQNVGVCVCVLRGDDLFWVHG